MIKLTPTFFDDLMISDSERIHSQVIAWILRIDNGLLPNKQKSIFLKDLFNLKEEVIITNDLEVYTEVRHIDIIVKSSSHLFIIENKLKSSEHSLQTTRYSDVVKKEYDFTNTKPVFGFLTLVDDIPSSKEWVPIAYSKLLVSLKQLTSSLKGKEAIFAKEYIDTIHKLVFVFSEFTRNPLEFHTVFQDGNKSKHRKDTKYDNPLQEYIRINQLETIFQKAFFKSIASNVKVPDSQIEINGNYVSETRGNALIQIDIAEFEYNKKKFRIGFQLQGNTFKINMAHENYPKSKANVIDVNLLAEFRNSFHLVRLKARFNNPKEKSYTSSSWQMDKQVYETPSSQTAILINTQIDFIVKTLPGFYNRLGIVIHKLLI
nr:PD-(D/E)XK nuclease family protein [uncultured Flavobacterium sp.]